MCPSNVNYWRPYVSWNIYIMCLFQMLDKFILKLQSSENTNIIIIYKYFANSSQKKCFILSQALRFRIRWTCKTVNDIATEKALFSSLVSFLFLNKNICCGYSLEAPRRGEALLMSTHNICIRWEIRKILCGYPLLSVAMKWLPLVWESISIVLYTGKTQVSIWLRILRMYIMKNIYNKDESYK